MTLGVPKPQTRTDSEKRVDALTKAWARKDRWRQKAILKAKGKPRTKVKPINPRATKRQHERYMKLIRSEFNLQLRYDRYVVAEGWCECDECVKWRKAVNHAGQHGGTFRTEDAGKIAVAIVRPAVWFTKSGTKPYKRFRSTEGQLHHLPRGYTLTEREHPDAIKYVRWMWKSCHERIESQLGTRRRFLKS